MIKKAHCLFEQSGTFKKEFIKLGIPAEDYDLQDEFGETDHICDLFEEIRGGYENKASIFDDIEPDDIVLAFFPCTRFECQVNLWLRGENNSQIKWDENRKIEYSMRVQEEITEFYQIISKLVIIANNRNFKLIIENPYQEHHYLTRYWCIKPAIIDRDRTQNGDFYIKPTQYFFINIEPKENFIFEPLEVVPLQKICNQQKGANRSLIHPQYASRFIKKYVLEDYDTMGYWKGE